jgi:hypothetical protein
MNRNTIKKFVKREANDFTPHKDAKWINDTTMLVIKRIKSVKNGNIIYLRSLTNVGLIARELKINVRTKTKGRKYNYQIILCSCGHLEHTAFLYKLGEAPTTGPIYNLEELK